MELSSSNTGSTDLRETDVQQPNTAATLSTVMSWRAFSAKSGQFDAGSTTTASSFLPSTPPFEFISSIVMSATSRRDVSLMAIVPEREWRIPILMVSPPPAAADTAGAGAAALDDATADAAAGAGAASSLLQPSVPSWQSAASTMSH